MSSEHLDRGTELARLVHSARSDVPDAALLSRIAARLPEGAPPVAAPSAGAASAAGLSGGAKLLLGLVLAGGVGAASYAAFGGGFGGETQQARVAEASGASTAQSVSAAEPAASVAEVSAFAPDAAKPDAVKPDAAAGQGSGSLRAGLAASSADVKSAKPSAAYSLAQEAQLLERARRELVKQPAKALATTQEHKRRFPMGVLSQEREVIAIQALKALKRESEANSRAAAFEAEHPESAHQRKVESVVGP